MYDNYGFIEVHKYVILVKFTFVDSILTNFYSLGGCPFGQDEVWNITWPATNASTTARQKCPGSSEAQGKCVATG